MGASQGTAAAQSVSPTSARQKIQAQPKALSKVAQSVKPTFAEQEKIEAQPVALRKKKHKCPNCGSETCPGAFRNNFFYQLGTLFSSDLNTTDELSDPDPKTNDFISTTGLQEMDSDHNSEDESERTTNASKSTSSMVIYPNSEDECTDSATQTSMVIYPNSEDECTNSATQTSIDSYPNSEDECTDSAPETSKNTHGMDSYPNSEDECTDSAPQPNLPVKVIRCDQTNEDHYKISKARRGRCVIISNKNFKNPDHNRKGTEKDVERLTDLFNQLSFEVVLHEDKTQEEMLSEMRDEAKEKDHWEADCFVCFVLSHGNEKGVSGIDGQMLSLDAITECMDGKHCRALLNKPKLFFIQACRGNKLDGAYDVENYSDQNMREVLHQPDLTDETDSYQSSSAVQAKADMLIAYSSYPGYKSTRDINAGSYFIQAVVDVFQKYAYKKDLLSMLTKVNRQVSKRKRNTDGKTQVCQVDTTLTRKVFFFPGMTSSTNYDFMMAYFKLRKCIGDSDVLFHLNLFP